eukprot:scaffold347_cov239-Pinguiococcus_pyrenoidosus.AAC.27
MAMSLTALAGTVVCRSPRPRTFFAADLSCGLAEPSMYRQASRSLVRIAHRLPFQLGAYLTCLAPPTLSFFSRRRTGENGRSDNKRTSEHSTSLLLSMCVLVNVFFRHGVLPSWCPSSQTDRRERAARSLATFGVLLETLVAGRAGSGASAGEVSSRMPRKGDLMLLLFLLFLFLFLLLPPLLLLLLLLLVDTACRKCRPPQVSWVRSPP